MLLQKVLLKPLLVVSSVIHKHIDNTKSSKCYVMFLICVYEYFTEAPRGKEKGCKGSLLLLWLLRISEQQ